MKKSVLIVDDEPHIVMLLKETLESVEEMGVELLSASNGEQSLELIKAHRPHLVLLDVMMPKVNGYDVCRTVKKEWGYIDVYIALVTAKGQEFDRRMGEEVGADIYLTKPFDPDTILQKCEEILGLG